MTKNILVTGAAGFLGSHLCDSLLKSGHNVIGIDNLSTGNIRNLEHIKTDKFKFYVRDVRIPFYFEVDEIYNLACPASPPAYQFDPVGTILTNVQGALNVLELAKNVGSKVFQSSTSEIYGDPLVHPQTESYLGNVNPIGPRACYDEGKRVVETLMTDYSKQYNVPVKIVRIFNTYGPRMDINDGRVISNFINQALSNESITIYGNGSQTRSFCYVDDEIRGFRSLMDTENSFIQPVNVGNPNEFTMLELASLILQKTGSKSNIIFKDLPVDDPKKRKPDISLAKSTLGWEPNIQLSEGLDKTIEYFISIRK